MYLIYETELTLSRTYKWLLQWTINFWQFCRSIWKWNPVNIPHEMWNQASQPPSEQRKQFPHDKLHTIHCKTFIFLFKTCLFLYFKSIIPFCWLKSLLKMNDCWMNYCREQKGDIQHVTIFCLNIVSEPRLLMDSKHKSVNKIWIDDCL